jgi:hypothetical protein
MVIMTFSSDSYHFLLLRKYLKYSLNFIFVRKTFMLKLGNTDTWNQRPTKSSVSNFWSIVI